MYDKVCRAVLSVVYFVCRSLGWSSADFALPIASTVWQVHVPTAAASLVQVYRPLLTFTGSGPRYRPEITSIPPEHKI